MEFPSGSEWLQMLWTAARTFIVTAIAQVLAYGVGVFDLSAGDWKAVAASAVAAVLMVVVRFLDTSNKSYGIKGKQNA
jgi:hypothetical protein